MKILVANLGSTSFKYRLFDMTDERQLARGAVERVGSAESRMFVEINGRRRDSVGQVPDHAAAVRQCLTQLAHSDYGCITDAGEVSAIGFKAVHAGSAGGVRRVTPELLSAMDEFAPAAPAHNPPYVAAMRLLRERLPEIPLVAAFETAFHATIPPRNRHYAVPIEWFREHDIRRWGFHGASHRYVATRLTELLGREDARIISCHLGGSSSLCAIRAGRSVATSMGMSPQSGLPHNNRVGDFDPFALPLLMRKTGRSLDELLDDLASSSGLLGLSGSSGDVRDLEAAAAAGEAQARLALDVFTSAVRHYLGAYLVELGGADAIAFAGGIGENGTKTRADVCAGLEELGIVLDAEANATATGESRINAPDSRVQIWIVPTNEELIVARQTKELLEQENS